MQCVAVGTSRKTAIHADRSPKALNLAIEISHMLYNLPILSSSHPGLGYTRLMIR
jgi:hypothetical protein